MKKRILAFLLAVSIAVSMLVLPASAAGNANTAVQLSITLNAMDSSQQAALNAVVTRGALARMLVSYSTYRESVGSQGTVGTLFTDLPGTSPYAPYVRIAVQNGWMNGYTDGSFRPDNAVTLEEAVTAILKLMGYKMTDLSGSFPNAQLNKASELGLRNQVDRSQGEVLNYEECALLFYNALTANTASGSAYGSSLGFTVSNGQVDTSSVMLKSLKGPFVAGDTVQLPFVPKMVYRNDKASESAELNKYDVYYYSESLQTLWVYTRRAAGRITAVSPSASAPTSVTVAGTSYTLGSSAVASQVSSLNGGGVGEVVTLLLGMNNEAAGIVTGEEADSVFYGVVQTATRSLVEENGADVLQKVSVMCTDGIARTVNVDKSLNFPQGWLVEIKVTPEGESVEHIDDRRVNGTINTNATALGAAALADDVEILDTTSEGVAGTVRPSRLSGVTLSDLDVRYYTVNDAGQIDRLILNDVTGDLWSYGVLDDVKNLAMNYSDLKSLVTSIAAGDSASGTTTTTGTTTGAATGGTDGSGSASGTTTTTGTTTGAATGGTDGSGSASGTTTTTGTTTGSTTGGTDGSGSASGTTTTVTGATAADRLSNLLVPTTSEILWGIVSGDILSTAWQKLTSNTGSLMSIGFQQIAEITGTPFKQIFNYIGGGATYICYVNGAAASYTTAIKYPVLAGGIAVRQETTGSVKAMMQLMPLKIDKVGAASVLSGNERYEMADNVQVYLWYKGQYYPTKLAQVDADGYQLTGWYDNFGCAAGKKVRVIIAVKND